MRSMIFLVVFAVFIGSCTGKEKRPPATGSACQGSSCETDTEQTSADANRVEQLTTTINTLKRAITNNRQLSAAEIDTLQQKLEEKNTELQTLGKEHGGKIESFQQTITELQENLAKKEREIEEINAEHQTEINGINSKLSALEREFQTSTTSSAQDAEVHRDTINDLNKQLTEAKKEIEALEAKGADVSLLEAEISRLDKLINERQAFTDGAPPTDGEDTVTETPAADAPTSSDCQAKLCAYYEFSKSGNLHYYTKGRVVVKKGTDASNNLTIDSGKIFYKGENKFVLDVVVHATKNSASICYHAEMKRQFFHPVHKTSQLIKLIPSGDQELCTN